MTRRVWAWLQRHDELAQLIPLIVLGGLVVAAFGWANK